jgi:hypothetical protein
MPHEKTLLTVQKGNPSGPRVLLHKTVYSTVRILTRLTLASASSGVLVGRTNDDAGQAKEIEVLKAFSVDLEKVLQSPSAEQSWTILQASLDPGETVIGWYYADEEIDSAPRHIDVIEVQRSLPSDADLFLLINPATDEGAFYFHSEGKVTPTGGFYEVLLGATTSSSIGWNGEVAGASRWLGSALQERSVPSATSSASDKPKVNLFWLDDEPQRIHVPFALSNIAGAQAAVQQAAEPQTLEPVEEHTPAETARELTPADITTPPVETPDIHDQPLYASQPPTSARGNGFKPEQPAVPFAAVGAGIDSEEASSYLAHVVLPVQRAAEPTGATDRQEEQEDAGVVTAGAAKAPTRVRLSRFAFAALVGLLLLVLVYQVYNVLRSGPESLPDSGDSQAILPLVGHPTPTLVREVLPMVPTELPPTSAPPTLPPPTSTPVPPSPTPSPLTAEAAQQQVSAALEQFRSGQLEAVLTSGNSNSTAFVEFDLGDESRPPRLHTTTRYQGSQGSQTQELISIGSETWRLPPYGRWEPIEAQSNAWEQLHAYLPQMLAPDQTAIATEGAGHTLSWFDPARNTDVILQVDLTTFRPLQLRRIHKSAGTDLTVKYLGWNTPVDIASPSP